MNREDAGFERAVREIQEDRTRGASELAHRCLDILADSARALPSDDAKTLRADLILRAGRLQAVRPSMAPVQNLLVRWCETLAVSAQDNLTVARAEAAEAASELSRSSRRAVSKIARAAARLLGPNKTLMTHSLSSTVVAACRELQGRGLRMIVTESRPLTEGHRLAEMLADWRVPTTYITDAQMGLFVRHADAVVVGADSVLADGAVVNKAGTYLLALVARDLNVPFFVGCESFKFRRQTADAIVLEEMDAGELGFDPPAGVTLRNLYFDVTPARLVTGWITENGFLRSWERIHNE
jgi:translation initiation factor 2B subunit (eIF-2B alpha/beta/delta family)